jgi:hypothetical protein
MTTTPRVIRLDPNGPAGLGLQPLDLDPADFQSPLPQQHHHPYFSDPAIGLNVGVWDTTTMQETFGPYPGDEFILVLEGAFAMLDARGRAVAGRAGQMVAFRNAAPMSWKQEGYLRKLYLTLRPPGQPTPRIETAEGAVIVIDPETRLTDSDSPPADAGTGHGTAARKRVIFRNDAGTMTVGLRDWGACDAVAFTPFPRHEFVVMAAGEVTLREPGGVAQTFVPGDAFFVPQGTPCLWHGSPEVEVFFAAVAP